MSINSRFYTSYYGGDYTQPVGIGYFRSTSSASLSIESLPYEVDLYSANTNDSWDNSFYAGGSTNYLYLRVPIISGYKLNMYFTAYRSRVKPSACELISPRKTDSSYYYYSFINYTGTSYSFGINLRYTLPKTYSINLNLTNITSTNENNTTTEGYGWSTYLHPAEGYSLPTTVSVSGTYSGEVQYNSTSGFFNISTGITSNITITASAILNKTENLYIGNNKATKVSIGNTEVTKIYKGNTKIYGS